MPAGAELAALASGDVVGEILHVDLLTGTVGCEQRHADSSFFDDKDGFNTGVDQHLWEGTVTFGYAPVKSFELRGEFRYDTSQAPGFLRGIEPRASYGSSLSEIAIQGVYKFAAPPPAP